MFTEFLKSIPKTCSDHGVDFLGIAKISKTDEREIQRYQAWIDQGKHAQMNFLEKNLECRKDPSLILAGVKSSIILALNYKPKKSGYYKDFKSPQISSYARVNDYHKTLRRVGELLLSKIKGYSTQVAGRVIVDTVPMLERAYAAKFSDGYIGKNTMYIHSERGSFLFLGEVLLSVSLEPTPSQNTLSCGSCSRCQTHCPTGALDSAYSLDANKCLSYWSIEHRGLIPVSYWPWFEYYYFGCDICQSVCPKNRRKPSGVLSDSFIEPSLLDTLKMNQKGYETMFGGSVMTRAKISGLKRNAFIALCVIKNEDLNEALAYARISDCDLLRQTYKQAKDEFL